MAKRIETINNGTTPSPKGYNKIESWDSETIEKLASHYHGILKLLGEDPGREGLENTPVRVAKAMNFLTMGYGQNPGEIINSAKFREEYKQMVLVKDIELYSLCEHHMLPFFVKAHVAYIPNGYITGCRFRKGLQFRFATPFRNALTQWELQLLLRRSTCACRSAVCKNSIP